MSNIACKNNTTPLIKTLIENNCDLNIRNSNGETPLDIASKEKNEELVRVLFECGCLIPNDYLYKYPYMLNTLEDFLEYK